MAEEAKLALRGQFSEPYGCNRNFKLKIAMLTCGFFIGCILLLGGSKGGHGRRASGNMLPKSRIVPPPSPSPIKLPGPSPSPVKPPPLSAPTPHHYIDQAREELVAVKDKSDIALHAQQASTNGTNSKHIHIIGMGLPKTGTTATAHALLKLGFGVTHNSGDKLGQSCNVILNTLENQYKELDRKYPTARWLITYSANVTEWMNSWTQHQARKMKSRGLQSRSSCNGLKWCNTTNTCASLKIAVGHDNLFKDCRHSWPCVMTPGERALLACEYTAYYDQLFQYFEGRQYALIDVRQNRYVNLPYIHAHLEAPFSAKNTKDSPGDWSQLNQCFKRFRRHG